MSRTILFAEDNAALANVVKFCLRRAGFDVTHAENGREAWRLAQRQPYDLVLTDHQMPLLSGVELCRLLRRHERYRTTPIILLTAKKLELNNESLRSELDVASIVAKPFSPIQLIETIENQLAARAGAEAP